MFFGSAINNFGVQEILQALVEWAPPPQPRDGGTRIVEPAEPSFTGFVFKIQANMDPQAPRPHRVLPRVLGPLQRRG